MTTRSCYYCYCCIDNAVVIVIIIVIVVLLLAQNILSKGTLGPNFNTGAKGSPTIKISLFIWALPVGGGGSKPLSGWFGAPI